MASNRTRTRRSSATLANEGGLLGISGVSGDIRDFEKAADEGNERAKLALDVYVSEIRRYLGGMLVELGGADAIVFTGGIGENGRRIRTAVCQGLDEFGIRLCADANERASGECDVAAEGRSRADLGHTDERRDDRCRSSQRTFGKLRSVTMFVAKVTGSLVSTHKVETMVGSKLLVVEPYRLEAKNRKSLATTGRTFIAVDSLVRRGRLRAAHARIECAVDPRNEAHAD